MFCQTCGLLLKPFKTEYGKWLRCQENHPQPKLNTDSITLTQENRKQGKNIEVADGQNILAVHDHVCKRCGFAKAQLIEISAQYSDEDNAYRMKCGSCGFVEQLEGKVK